MQIDGILKSGNHFAAIEQHAGTFEQVNEWLLMRGEHSRSVQNVFTSQGGWNEPVG